MKEKVISVFIIIHYCWLPFSYMRLTLTKTKKNKVKKQKMHQHVVNAVDAVTFHFRFLPFNGTFMHDQINSNFFLLLFTSNDSSQTFLWHYKFMIVTSLKVATTTKKREKRSKQGEKYIFFKN